MPKVKVEKIIKANKEKIFDVVTDFENLPQRFPQFFKSVKVISREGNTVTTEDNAMMAGILAKGRIEKGITEVIEEFQRVAESSYQLNPYLREDTK